MSILAALRRYHFLTLSQLGRAVMVCSASHLQRLVKPLADRRYLVRLCLKRATQRGSVPFVYTLGPKGIGLFRAQGCSLSRWRCEVETAEYWHLNHTLALNDCLLTLELLTRQDETITVEHLLHERDLKVGYAVPVTITRNGSAMQTSWVPDAWLRLTGWDVAGAYREHLALEIDMGSMDQQAWREKVRKIVGVLAEPTAYAQRYGTTALRIGVIACPAERPQVRLDNLIRWTEAELAYQQAERFGAAFSFTCATPQTVLAGELLYLASCWRTPFTTELMALVEGRNGGPLR